MLRDFLLARRHRVVGLFTFVAQTVVCLEALRSKAYALEDSVAATREAAQCIFGRAGNLLPVFLNSVPAHGAFLEEDSLGAWVSKMPIFVIRNVRARTDRSLSEA
jgi:hypothetical protein